MNYVKKSKLRKSIEKSILDSSKIIKNSSQHIKEIEDSIQLITECLKNVKKDLTVSKKLGAITIGLLGSKGGSIGKICDVSIIINSSSTPRIQEAHRTIYHIICEEVEKKFEGI